MNLNYPKYHINQVVYVIKGHGLGSDSSIKGDCHIIAYYHCGHRFSDQRPALGWNYLVKKVTDVGVFEFEVNESNLSLVFSP